MAPGIAEVLFKRHGILDQHVPVGPSFVLNGHCRLDGAGTAAVTREARRSPATSRD
jgi:transketolase